MSAITNPARMLASGPMPMLLPAVVPARLPLDTVVCADALQFLRGLPSESVDAVITDPPYGTNKAAWDKPIDRAIFQELYRVTRGYLLIFYSNAELYYPLSALKECGAQPWIIVWSKTNSMERAYKYFPQWTPVIAAYKPGAPFWGQDLFTCPIVPQAIKHATPKPIKALEILISRATAPGQIILDPFCGSGTTLIAARNLGRRYIGCDVSQEYVADCKQRLAQPYTLSLFDKPVPAIQETLL